MRKRLLATLVVLAVLVSTLTVVFTGCKKKSFSSDNQISIVANDKNIISVKFSNMSKLKTEEITVSLKKSYDKESSSWSKVEDKKVTYLAYSLKDVVMLAYENSSDEEFKNQLKQDINKVFTLPSNILSSNLSEDYSNLYLAYAKKGSNKDEALTYEGPWMLILKGETNEIVNQNVKTVLINSDHKKYLKNITYTLKDEKYSQIVLKADYDFFVAKFLSSSQPIKLVNIKLAAVKSGKQIEVTGITLEAFINAFIARDEYQHENENMTSPSVLQLKDISLTCSTNTGSVETISLNHVNSADIVLGIEFDNTNRSIVLRLYSKTNLGTEANKADSYLLSTDLVSLDIIEK